MQWLAVSQKYFGEKKGTVPLSLVARVCRPHPNPSPNSNPTP